MQEECDNILHTGCSILAYYHCTLTRVSFELGRGKRCEEAKGSEQDAPDRRRIEDRRKNVWEGFGCRLELVEPGSPGVVRSVLAWTSLTRYYYYSTYCFTVIPKIERTHYRCDTAQACLIRGDTRGGQGQASHSSSVTDFTSSSCSEVVCA